MKEEIKNRIRELKKVGISNAYVARQIGVSRTTICLFLKDERELKEIQLKRLQEVLENYKFL